MASPPRRSSSTRLLLGPLLGCVSDRAPWLVQTNLFVGQGEGVGAGGEWGDWGRCECTDAVKELVGSCCTPQGTRLGALWWAGRVGTIHPKTKLKI